LKREILPALTDRHHSLFFSRPTPLSRPLLSCLLASLCYSPTCCRRVRRSLGQWRRFGPDALERNLVDELITSDDVLLQKFDEGAEIFSVKYEEPKKAGIGALLPGASVSDALAGMMWQWILSKAPQNVASTSIDALQQGMQPGGGSLENRFMAMDPLRTDQTTRL